MSWYLKEFKDRKKNAEDMFNQCKIKSDPYLIKEKEKEYYNHNFKEINQKEANDIYSTCYTAGLELTSLLYDMREILQKKLNERSPYLNIRIPDEIYGECLTEVKPSEIKDLCDLFIDSVNLGWNKFSDSDRTLNGLFRDKNGKINWEEHRYSQEYDFYHFAFLGLDNHESPLSSRIYYLLEKPNGRKRLQELIERYETEMKK